MIKAREGEEYFSYCCTLTIPPRQPPILNVGKDGIASIVPVDIWTALFFMFFFCPEPSLVKGGA
jgi:hypothetical protein